MRQDAAERLAKKVDLMLVVGDKMSGNTKRLYELCSKIVKTERIESASEIKPEWLKLESLGITAGASTPDWIIEDIVNALKSDMPLFEQKTVEYKSKINHAFEMFFDSIRLYGPR